MSPRAASGLIMGGLAYSIPGCTVVNWRDDPLVRLKMPEDGRRRPSPIVDHIVVHTSLGAPDRDFPHAQTILPGLGPSSNAGEALVDVWSHDHKCAGAALVIDFDGVIYCLADVLLEETYHATTVNARSVGIEYRQGRAASELYRGQLAAGAALVNWLTMALEIPRTIPLGYTGHPVPMLAAGGHGYRGVFGHRDQSEDRGAGDPGDAIMSSFGYRALDLRANGHMRFWGAVQAWLGFGMTECDGIPGPHTFSALRARGFAGGQIDCPPPGVTLPPQLAA